MSAMEVSLRAALVAWLAADPALNAQLNAVVEEVPSRTALPWLAIAATASADWSTKDKTGREVRVALELHCRGDRPDTAAERHLPVPPRPRRAARRQCPRSAARIPFSPDRSLIPSVAHA
jgi:hypothetical protein